MRECASVLDAFEGDADQALNFLKLYSSPTASQRAKNPPKTCAVKPEKGLSNQGKAPKAKIPVGASLIDVESDEEDTPREKRARAPAPLSQPPFQPKSPNFNDHNGASSLSFGKTEHLPGDIQEPIKKGKENVDHQTEKTASARAPLNESSTGVWRSKKVSTSLVPEDAETAEEESSGSDLEPFITVPVVQEQSDTCPTSDDSTPEAPTASS